MAVEDSAAAWERNLGAQIEELRRRFPELEEVRELDSRSLTLRLTLRGVPVEVSLALASWPEDPPGMRIPGSSWLHPNVRADGRIVDLRSQAQWNRTIPLSDVLSELELAFTQVPPTKVASIGARLRQKIRALFSL